MEQWKQIVIDDIEYDYEVSDLGNVRNMETGRILKSYSIRGGYLQVGLWKNGERQYMLVHRLVSQAFIPNPNGYSEINHKNEDKTDNRVDNLEWCTRKYNVNYGVRTKKASKSRHKKVMAISLTEKKVLVFQSESQAIKLGFDQGCISRCCNDKQKSHKGYKWKYIN